MTDLDYDHDHDFWYPGDGTPQNCRHDQHLALMCDTDPPILQCQLCGLTAHIPRNWTYNWPGVNIQLQPAVATRRS